MPEAPDGSEPGDQGEGALEETWKTEIRLFSAAQNQAAAVINCFRSVGGDREPSVQPHKASMQIREGRVLQRTQKRLRPKNMSSDPKNQTIKAIFGLISKQPSALNASTSAVRLLARADAF